MAGREWTRRAFLLGPAAVWAAAPSRAAGWGVERVRLMTDEPWREMETLWRRSGWGMPRRVVARAAPGWWRSGELPDRWAAWMEFEGGRALVLECAPEAWVEQRGPRPGFQPGEAVAKALMKGRVSPGQADGALRSTRVVGSAELESATSTVSR